jgi:hypothetical protein
MTGGTSGTVFRMIEPDVESAQRWKSFNLSALNIRVTDRADLACRICELLRMTAGARCMCGFTR